MYGFQYVRITLNLELQSNNTIEEQFFSLKNGTPNVCVTLDIEKLFGRPFGGNGDGDGKAAPLVSS